MRKLAVFISVFVFVQVIPALTLSETIDVLIKGVDDGVKTSRQKDYKEAVMNAKLQAIERAGVEVESITKIVNFQMKYKAVESKAKAVLLPGFQIMDVGYLKDGSYQVVLVGKVKTLAEGLDSKELRYAKSLMERGQKAKAKGIITDIIKNSKDDNVVAEAMYCQVLWKFASDERDIFEKVKAYYPNSKYVNRLKTLLNDREREIKEKERKRIEAKRKRQKRMEEERKRLEAKLKRKEEERKRQTNDDPFTALNRLIEAEMKNAERPLSQYALFEIALVQAKLGEISQAMTTARQIESRSYQDSIANEIVLAQAKQGDILNAMVTAKTISSPYYQSVAYINIALTEVRQKDLSNARKTLKMALRVASHVNYNVRSKVIAKVALAQSKLGDNDLARATFAHAVEAAKRSYSTGHNLREIVSAQAEVGFISAAIETAKIRETVVQGRVVHTVFGNQYHAANLAAISSAQTRAGDVDAARESFNRALEYARNVKDEWSRAKVLSEIASVQAAAGNFFEAFAVANTIAKAEHFIISVSNIAVAQAKAGDNKSARESISRAQDTVKEIQKDYSRAQALMAIAVAQVAIGNFFEALNTAKSIQDVERRAEAFKVIAEAITRDA